MMSEKPRDPSTDTFRPELWSKYLIQMLESEKVVQRDFEEEPKMALPMVHIQFAGHDKQADFMCHETSDKFGDYDVVTGYYIEFTPAFQKGDDLHKMLKEGWFEYTISVDGRVCVRDFHVEVWACTAKRFTIRGRGRAT